MIRFLVTCLLASQLLLSSAHAAGNHAEQAIIFAKKEKWADARASARASGDAALQSYVQWRYLLAPDNGASFSDIKTFLDKHPSWPKQDTLLIRAEQAIYRSPPAPDEIIRWFTLHPPQSGRCKKLLAETLLSRKGNKKQAEELLKDAWINGSFTSGERDTILKAHKAVLTQAVHIEAVDAMLWRGDTRPAKLFFSRVDDDHRKLFTARLRLLEGGEGVDGAIRAVPPKLAHDPGLLYDRMVWRHKQHMEDGVLEILALAPSDVPHPEAWWKIRKQYVRELILERQYKKAYELAKNHGQTEGEEFADAEWLAGWIAYTFLHDFSAAYKHFYALDSKVQFAMSKARAAYWAARAAEAHKQPDTAKKWWAMAHKYPGTFYGQLSFASREQPTSPFPLPDDPKPGKKITAAFEKMELVSLIRTLGKAKEYGTARELILYLIDTAETPEERALAATLGKDIGRTDYSVRAAKNAMQENTLLRKTGFPVIAHPGKSPIEEALMLAIVRQESEFRPDAKSSAGALGLMQVLPATARLVARRNHINYSVGRLTQAPSYNLQLGSLYLAQVLERFDNSYPLAIAAYNAGPNRVAEWLEQFGDPRTGKIDMLTWMEMIPYSETRNYVQRVLENLQIYRAILSGEKNPTLRLQQDMGDVARQ